ncbi:hypothetical protein CURT_0368 [Campylobacter ureolyticus]|uniref:Uncharacterized protein n=1 Tax=Campylobacter ureolyticus TaxID=827 RepID=A0AAE7JNX6_9BACT|nr:hypothetical protein CURT_0368 [Campylobacter ureolyticus]
MLLFVRPQSVRTHPRTAPPPLNLNSNFKRFYFSFNRFFKFSFSFDFSFNIFYFVFFLGVPLRVGLFACIFFAGAKKDTATIPNAGS